MTRLLWLVLLATRLWARCPPVTTTTLVCSPNTFTYQTGATGCGNPNCGAKTKDVTLDATDPLGRDDGLGLAIGNSDGVSTDWERALLEFDASDIPHGAIVTSATLTLDVYSGDFPTSPGHICRLRRPNWVEQEATWETYAIPGGTPLYWTTPGASDPLSDFESPGSGSTACVPFAGLGSNPDGPVNYNVTGLVQDAIDNRGGHLRVRFAQDNPLDTHLFDAGDSELVFFHGADGLVQHPLLSVSFDCVSATTIPVTTTTLVCESTTSSTSTTTTTTTSTTTTTLVILNPSLWIDATSGVDTPLCGTDISTPCADYYYLMNVACGGGGCASTIPQPGGTTIEFRTGTYHGDGNPNASARTFIGVPFDGTASDPVVLECYDSTGIGDRPCIIDMAGVTGLSVNMGAFMLGNNLNVKNQSVNIASYITVRGFTIAPLAGTTYRGIMIARTDTGPWSNHILVDNVDVDGTNLSDFGIFGTIGVGYYTIKHSRVRNMPANSLGAIRIDRSTNVAIVGNEMGPTSGTLNNDCANLLGITTALEDGNFCHNYLDGFDAGMDEDTPAIDRTIRRYNIAQDILPGANPARCFPTSGNDNTAATGENVIYKNVCLQTATGGESLTTLYQTSWDTHVWFNTAYLQGGNSPMIYAQGLTQGQQDDSVGYNVVSSSTSTGDLTALYFASAATTACPTTHPCPYLGNIFWDPEHDSSRCVTWHPSDAAQTQYSCTEIGTTFNSLLDHVGNRHVDPVFTNRRTNGLSVSAADLVLQPSSPAIDVGDGVCHTTGSGTGTTIPVTCTGLNHDPRYWFPQPGDYYGLGETDCTGLGARGLDGAALGCFDIQIAGCGTRKVVSEDATSITVDSTCAYGSGDIVHVPWNGAGPDAGGLEAPFDASSTTTSTVTSTSAGSSTTTTSTSTTSTTLDNLVDVLLGSGTSAPSTSVVNYNSIPPLATWSTSEPARQSLVAEAGQFGGLRIVLDAAPGTGKSWTFTVSKNQSPTSLACTISDSATACHDTTGAHDVAVTAGDTYDVSATPSGTPATAFPRVSILFEPTTRDHTLWPLTGVMGNSSNFYMPLGGVSTAGDSTSKLLVPVNGTVTNLHTWCATAVAAAASRTMTVHKNGGSTSVTCTQNTGETTCADTSDSINVTPGDFVNLAYVPSGTPGSGINCAAAMTFIPDTTGVFVWAESSPTATPTTGTKYAQIDGVADGSLGSTEDATILQATQVGTVLGMEAQLTGVPGSGATETFTLRVNTADSALTCAITGATATFCGATNSIAIADDDLLSTSIVQSGSTATARAAKTSYAATYTGTFP